MANGRADRADGTRYVKYQEVGLRTRAAAGPPEKNPILSAATINTFVELLKPITWFAPIWAFACGVVASGTPAIYRWPTVIAGFLLCGPLVCGTSQAVNDWYDRHVDAINEPGRPIPSGRVPGRWGLAIATLWTVLSIAVAALLGPWVFGPAIAGLALAWMYSAPPLRLKQNGWYGNAAVAACYEGLPWLAGVAVMSNALPGWHIFTIASLYSAGAHGIMTLNDFKSLEGDRRMDIRSLPVQLGIDRASRVACLIMTAAQAAVVVLLALWHQPIHAAGIALLLGVQLYLMRAFLRSPRERAPWYNATGTSLYVLGMLTAAFAVRPTLG
jgi:chlorophyll/bacteriochlorophyll a synthase